jgi:hypothetical protein
MYTLQWKNVDLYTVTWCLKDGIVKSEKTVIARQRLVETCLRYNGESKHVFMTTANNKGMNCCTWCSISDPREGNSEETTESRDRIHEREREFQMIEDARWRLYFVWYSCSNTQSVTIKCSYNLWASNIWIQQSKPRLWVTNTRDNTFWLR